MRYNGTISFELDSVTERNEFGEITSNETEFSEPQPCFIRANTDNRIGRYDDGEFHMASYTVLVGSTDIPTNGRVRLLWNDRPLGEHRIISVEPITTFKRTRIVV